MFHTEPGSIPVVPQTHPVTRRQLGLHQRVARPLCRRLELRDVGQSPEALRKACDEHERARRSRRGAAARSGSGAAAAAAEGQLCGARPVTENPSLHACNGNAEAALGHCPLGNFVIIPEPGFPGKRIYAT